MFNFNIRQAPIYPALRWEKILKPKALRAVRIVLTVGFVLTAIPCGLSLLVILVESFFPVIIASPAISSLAYVALQPLAGLTLIFWAAFFFLWLVEKFFETKLKQPLLRAALKDIMAQPENFNLAEFLSFDLTRAINKSIKWARKRNIEVSSVLLFYFILLDNSKLDFVFLRALLNSQEIKEGLRKHLEPLSSEAKPGRAEELFSDLFKQVILTALKRASTQGKARVDIGDALVALATDDPIFKKILIENNLKPADIENLVWWLENLERRSGESKKFWQMENLAKMGTLAKSWAAGYTLTLDEYSIDLTDALKKTLPEIIGHQKEVKAVERILSQTKINNVLLIGEPGTGRRSIVHALAIKSFLGQSSPAVNYKRVVEIDMSSFLARVQDSEKVEQLLNQMFEEAVSGGNIILVIDEFHNYVGGEARPGVVDISGVLGAYLHLPRFQIIAITTYAGLHKKIEQNPTILNLFEKVEVSEISDLETLMLLENLTLQLEKTHKRLISQPSLRQVVTLSERWLPNLSFPKKAMDLLDQVLSYVATATEDPVVLPQHVEKVIAEKAEVPVGPLGAKEREILLSLEARMHQRIVNQDEAVREVCEALKRARSELTIRKGPMGGFLFLGPTGVGKTETAKALADIYFGSEKRMIRLDMSEFQDIKDIPRLLGASGQEGLLTTPVLENPFALVLLDELEKAHPNILNLFLQVLDEGHITDGQGRKVSFINTLIIATSNAGYQLILKALKDQTEWSKVKPLLLEQLFAEGLFRPEFINRFDAVVVFRPLTPENLLAIAGLLLQKLQKNLKEKDIEFVTSKALKKKIVELGYSPTFGAREMRRVIQDKIENVLANALLSNQLQKGDRVEMNPENFELLISKAG